MIATGLTHIIRWLIVLLVVLISGLPPLVGSEEEREREERAVREREDRTEREERVEELARRQYEEARRALREALLQMAEVQSGLAEREHILRSQTIVFPGRAGLGIVVQTEPDPETDSLGAAIVAVTPGSAAEEAGLKTGDVITGVNGEPLVVRHGRGRRQGIRPETLLVQRARRLRPGDEMRIEFLRDGESRVVTVEARPLPQPTVSIMPHWLSAPDGLSLITLPHLEDLPRIWIDLSRLEMVDLNPDLGEYFGVGEGVLVVEAPEESVLKIRSGDVLLSVGEFRLKTTQQAARALRGIRPGEPVVLRVLRKGARITLTTTVPDPALEDRKRSPEPRRN